MDQIISSGSMKLDPTRGSCFSFLLNLPCEIRETIWTMVFSNPTPQLVISFGKCYDDTPASMVLHVKQPLLYTCKQVYYEASYVLKKCFELHMLFFKNEQNVQLFRELMLTNMYDHLQTIVLYCDKRYGPLQPGSAFRFRDFPSLKTLIFRLSFHIRIGSLYEPNAPSPETEEQFLRINNDQLERLSSSRYRALPSEKKVAAWMTTPYAWPTPIIATIAEHDTEGWLDDLLEPTTHGLRLADRCRWSTVRNSMDWERDYNRQRRKFHIDDQKVIGRTKILIETLCDPCNLCIETDFGGYIPSLLVVVDAKQRTVVERRLLNADEYYSRIKLNSYFMH